MWRVFIVVDFLDTHGGVGANLVMLARQQAAMNPNNDLLKQESELDFWARLYVNQGMKQ